jgi:hypothetical protein
MCRPLVPVPVATLMAGLETQSMMGILKLSLAVRRRPVTMAAWQFAAHQLFRLGGSVIVPVASERRNEVQKTTSRFAIMLVVSGGI